MIEGLIAGERDPAVLADLAKARLRRKIPELVRALDARFGDDHAAQLRQLLDHIDWLDVAICRLDDRSPSSPSTTPTSSPGCKPSPASANAPPR